MTIETKSSADQRVQCQRAGSNIDRLQVVQRDLRHQIQSVGEKVYAVRLQSEEAEQQIRQIENAQQAARALPSRSGPVGTLAGEITAQIIRLATQKDALERQLDQLRNELSRHEGRPVEAQRRLESVEYQLDQSHAAFDRLGCRISDRSYG